MLKGMYNRYYSLLFGQRKVGVDEQNMLQTVVLRLISGDLTHLNQQIAYIYDSRISKVLPFCLTNRNATKAKAFFLWCVYVCTTVSELLYFNLVVSWSVWFL